MGHVRNYTIGDMIARYRRMCGYNVMQPWGWDAFGMPAENAAINNSIAPAIWTKRNIDEMRIQIKRFGLAVDWQREFATCDPEYYRWEQQLFVRLFKQGLVYKKKSTVNWDPVDNTVLANEQVVDGCGWRSGVPVERREIPMYFMKITDYADELLEEINQLEGWPESVKSMQKNWLGRSEGAHINLKLTDGQVLQIFTTRPDTIFGATFCAVAPEHPLAQAVAESNPKIADFISRCKRLAVSEEAINKADKEGLDTGLRVRHPFVERELPVYVANFILMQYGTGAIYGCPAHDQRDLDFARSKNLPVIPVVLPPKIDEKDFCIGNEACTTDGTMINSDFLNGMDSVQAKNQVIDRLAANGEARRDVQYRLRDWGVSRQRYWGCPIPIVYCDSCGDVPVPEKDLPVLLPHNVTIDGQGSPLAKMESFTHCACPACGKAARRETDTLDTFVESSWYFARFASHDCDDAMIDERAAHWMPVDQYIGGIEHACLHLLYARFFHKLMRDAGMYPTATRYNEPFNNLLCQGMVLNSAYYHNNGTQRQWVAPSDVSLKTDSKGKVLAAYDINGNTLHNAGKIKMSKSFNNGVDPEQMVSTYGADTARLFVLFNAPPEQSLEWSDDGLRGCARFLGRLWNAVHELPTGSNEQAKDEDTVIASTQRRLHQLLAKANYDINRLHLNNIPSAAMSMTNELQNAKAVINDGTGASLAGVKFLREGYLLVLRLLAPAVPHITQALWEYLGKDGLIANAEWPQADQTLLAYATQTLVVQVNGKRRGQIEVPADAGEEDITAAARDVPAVTTDIAGKGAARKTIIVPGRIVNFVI